MKKTTKFLSLISVSLIALFSCNPNNSNPVNPIATDSLSGAFISEHIKSDSMLFNLGYADEENATAFFFTIPGDTSSLTLVDSVTVNNFPLEATPDQNGVYNSYYNVDSFSNLMNMTSTCNWHVYGSNGIPSFTYNYPVPYPSFTGTMPDTINKNAGVTFHLTFANADSVIIGITDSIAGMNFKVFSNSSTTQNFSATDLINAYHSNFLGNFNFIRVDAIKSTKQTFSGKHFLFTKVYEYYYPVWIQ